MSYGRTTGDKIFKLNRTGVNSHLMPLETCPTRYSFMLTGCYWLGSVQLFISAQSQFQVKFPASRHGTSTTDKEENVLLTVKVTLGVHPSSCLALVGSPNKKSTSVGLKCLGLILTRTTPVSASFPTSANPFPSQTILMPTYWNAASTNSRTECDSPVAMT